VNRIFALARKETLEILRDFRTLFILLFLPVLLYPVLVVGISFYVKRGQSEQARLDVYVGAYQCPEELVAAPQLKVGIRLELVPARASPSDFRSFLENELYQAIIDCSGLKDFPARPIRIYYLSAKTSSQLAESRVVEALAEFREAWLWRALEKLGFSSDFGPAFRPESTDLSPPARVSGFILAQIIPLVLVLIILQGAYHPSMDLVVGERERKTLDALLSSPVTAWDILAAKTLVISVVAWLAGVLNLVSLMINLSLASRLATNLGSSLFPGYTPILLVLLEMVPLAVLFASLFVSASAFSRTFRESQSHLVPVIFLVIAPATVMFIAIPTPNPIIYSLPVFSSLYLMKTTLLGSIDPIKVVISSVIAFATSAVLLKWGAFLWTSERTLYGPGESASVRKGVAGSVTAAEALALFIVAVFGVVITQFALGPDSIPLAMAASHIGVMGGGVFLAKRASPAGALRLRPISLFAILSAVLFGVASICLSQVFTAGLSQFLPAPTEFTQEVVKIIRALGPVLALFTLSLLPAIFEELLFRGLLFNAFARDWGLVFSLGLSSVLFGLMHFPSLLRVIQTAFLGLMLAYILLRCGSLLAPMIVHLMVNAFAVVLVLVRPEWVQDTEADFGPFILFAFTAIGLVCWLLADWIAGNLGPRPSAPDVV